MIKDRGTVDITSFLLLCDSSATSFDIATGKPSCDNVTNKVKVGNISMYRPMPFIPIILVVKILINIPNIFVIAPPIINIIVDLINFSFM